MPFLFRGFSCPMPGNRLQQHRENTGHCAGAGGMDARDPESCPMFRLASVRRVECRRLSTAGFDVWAIAAGTPGSQC